VIRRIEAEGSTEVPNFEVESAHNAVELSAAYHAIVNGQTGDVSLQSVDARFRRSEVRASGEIADRAPQQPKQASVELSVPHGRVEDFLYLFTQGRNPGLTGGVTLRAHAVIPPGTAEFLKKLRMNLTFRIAQARFTKPQTQEDLNRISRRAQGDKNGDETGPDVLSNFEGTISVAGGTARIASVSFQAPGATAHLSGTYDLLRKEVDLHGLAHLDTTLAKTQKGIKSFLLKVAQPFLEKKRNNGADVPIKFTGSWGHTSLGLEPSRLSKR
jgi:hypothetical protein